MLIFAFTKADLSRYLKEFSFSHFDPRRLFWGNSRLRSDFKNNVTMGRLGVVESLGTSLGIAVDTVVVAGSVCVHVVKGLKGDSVFGRVVTDGSSVTADVTVSDVVRSLSTEEETITTNDSIGSEDGAL